MSSIAGDRLLGRILGILIAAAALTACGGGTSGSTSASGSTATPSTGSSSSSGASATVVALSAPVYTVAPSAAAVVTINRSGSSTAAATVGYTTINGTAVAGSDYVATSGSVTWQAGEVGAKTVSIPVTSAANGKDFGFALTSVSGQADFGTPAAATIGITAAPGSSGGSVILSWNAPAENTNGTALTNLAGYDIFYGTNSSQLTQAISIDTVGLLTYVISNLSSGTWYFEVVALNSAGVASVPSGIVSATIS
jgi:Calx-beta domain